MPQKRKPHIGKVTSTYSSANSTLLITEDECGQMGDRGGRRREGPRTDISRGLLRSWGRAEAVKCSEWRSVKYLTVREQ